MIVGPLSPHLPLDSWPRTLLVEAVCLTSGQSRFTDREVVRLLNSPEVGPVGHWVLAEAASFAGQDDLARRFAERALALLTVDGFRPRTSRSNPHSQPVDNFAQRLHLGANKTEPMISVRTPPNIPPQMEPPTQAYRSDSPNSSGTLKNVRR